VQQQSKHFNCCFHDADDMNKFMQFLLKVNKSILRSICHRGGNEKGSHNNDNETVPRQRSGSGNSIEIPVQRKWSEIGIRRSTEERSKQHSKQPTQNHGMMHKQV